MLPELISLENYDFDYYRWENDMIDFWQDVPFLARDIPFSFTLIMQGLILAALLVTSYRKWKNESLPASPRLPASSFSRFYNSFSWFLWPFFSEGKASGLLGEEFSLSEADDKGGATTILLLSNPYSSDSLFGLLTLVNTCCPTDTSISKASKGPIDSVSPPSP